jgi:hypothetical protein
MSNCWLVHGVAHEKPRPEPGEYIGEDVYHPNQPTRGQIDELLLQFTGEHILVLAFDPSGCDSAEEVAEEVKKAVLWSYECRQKDLPARPQKHSSRLMIRCGEDPNLQEPCEHCAKHPQDCGSTFEKCNDALSKDESCPFVLTTYRAQVGAWPP